MGNIADALKKAGVGLSDEPGVVVEPEAVTFRTDETPVQSDDQQVEAGMEKRQAETVSPQGRGKQIGQGPWNERIQQVIDGSGPIAESFRVLRSKVLHPKDGRARPRTIMIASSAPEEGKSFVSINLAVAIAKGLDQYALLVDCDLRRPNLAKLLGLGAEKTRGLTEYLQGEADLGDLLLKTSVDKLSLFPSGMSPDNPAELLTSVRMSRMVGELANRYSDRIIIFDSPPFQVASESLVLAKNVDGVILVVGYGKSNRTRIKTMIEMIGKEKVLGLVFNGQREGYIKKKVLDPYGSYYGKYYKGGR